MQPLLESSVYITKVGELVKSKECSTSLLGSLSVSLSSFSSSGSFQPYQPSLPHMVGLEVTLKFERRHISGFMFLILRDKFFSKSLVKRGISRARSPSDDQEYLSDSQWANIESVESVKSYPGEDGSLQKISNQNPENAPGTYSVQFSNKVRETVQTEEKLYF